jgi:dipeptidyl-peptidase-4
MKSKQFSVLFLFLCFTVLGQQKISVEQIYNGAFRAQGMDELQSMKNTNQYTVLNVDSSSRTMQIDLYDFASLNKTATLIDTKDHMVYRGLIVIRLTGRKNDFNRL